MSDESPLVLELRRRIQELELDNARLRRQIEELRSAVDALMTPAPPEKM